MFDKSIAENFIWAIGIAGLVTLVTALGLDNQERQDRKWREQVTDVSQARNLIRACVKDMQGSAEVETVWEDGDEYGKPVSWDITCRWGER